MGHSDRTASWDLVLKKRDDASSTPQNIPETNGAKFGLTFTRHILNNHLGDPFGSPHHTGRIYRFIGWNEDKPFYTVFIR